MKKIIKRTLLVVLSLCIICSMMAGCTRASTDSRYVTLTPTPNPVAADYRGEITFSGYKSFDKDESNYDFIAAYNAQYPGVEVVLDEVDEQEYFDTLDERILNGTIGDVFVIDAARLSKYAEMGLIADLTSYLEDLISYDTFEKLKPSELLYDAAYDSCLYNGQYFMSAVEYSHEFVLINYSALEKAGLESPQDKWTWDDLYEYAEKLSTVEGIEKAVVLDCDDYAVWGSFARSYGDCLFTYDDYGNISNINLTNSKVIDGLQELADFAANDYVENTDIDSINAEDIEKYGMIICDRADFERWASYLEETENYTFTWDLIHFPRFVREEVDEEGNDVETTYYSIGAKSLGLAVLIRDDIEEDEVEEHYNMAASFALYSLEESAAIVYCGEGETVPANKNANDMKFWREYPVEGKNTSVFSLFDSSDFTAFLTPYTNQDAAGEFDVGEAIKDAAEGKESLRESLQRIQDAANSMID